MTDKEKKPNWFARAGKKIIKFFMELKSEMKKVVWPDRKKLTQSSITVVAICLLAAALIFAIDQILSGVLGAIGFFPKTSSTAASSLFTASTASVTSTVNPTDSASVSSASSTAGSSASTATSAN